MTYVKSSYPVYFPFGNIIPRRNVDLNADLPNYVKGKTKGEFAFVSNCHTVGHDRLSTMKELGKYIDVDIYGSCTQRKPCPKRMDSKVKLKFILNIDSIWRLRILCAQSK